MLWIPGILGAILFVLQVQDFLEVNSMENPYMLVYGVVLCLWTSAFTCLWKSLEKTCASSFLSAMLTLAGNRRQFEWDTVAFEEQEELRREFMEDEKTVGGSDGVPGWLTVGGVQEQGKHDNEVTGEKDRYYFDEGEYFPIPTGRSREKAWTYAVILLVDIFILFLQTFLWQMLHPLLDVEDNVAGSVMYGVASSFVIWGVDLIMDGVPELSFEGIVDRLTNNENWDTFTRYEDALIMHTFMYKMVNKFFPLIWVAFLANNVKVSGQYWRCYNWECYPVLSIVLVTQIILLQILYYVQIYVFPALRKMMSSEGKPAPPSGMRVIRAPMEIQYEWHNPTAVVDYYMVRVSSHFSVSLSFLPLIPLCCFSYLPRTLPSSPSPLCQLLTPLLPLDVRFWCISWDMSHFLVLPALWFPSYATSSTCSSSGGKQTRSSARLADPTTSARLTSERISRWSRVRGRDGGRGGRGCVR
eukprot:750996-Hanusia_phi.AAC.4